MSQKLRRPLDPSGWLQLCVVAAIVGPVRALVKQLLSFQESTALD